MTGGIIGVPWQIVHLKVSIIIFYTPSGTFVVLETSKRLAISPLMVLTSLAIRSILSLLLFVKGIKSLSSPDESDETVITFFVSPSRTAYMRRLPHFQNFKPEMCSQQVSSCCTILLVVSSHDSSKPLGYNYGNLRKCNDTLKYLTIWSTPIIHKYCL